MNDKVTNDEPGHSSVLETLHLLESPPEERFDRLARLAQQFFDVEGAAVIFQHGTRWWVKAWRGPAGAGEQIATLLAKLPKGAPVVITDAGRDARTLEHPLVVEPPYIRFLAAMPLFLDSIQVGTLCLMQSQPREFSAQHQHTLRALADCAEDEINLIQERHLRRSTKENQTRRQHQIELLARVAKETTNAVVITDRKGRVEWINDSFTRITGYTLDEVRGSTPGEFLQGRATDPAAVRQMSEAVSAGQPFNFEVLNYTKAGEQFWMQVQCNTLLDNEGELEGFIAIESDISRQKIAEAKVSELLERLEKLTANLPGIIYQFLLSPDGHFSMPYVSGGLARLFRITLPDLSQDATPIIAMIDPSDKPQVLQSIEDSAEHLTLWESRFRLLHPEGAKFWVEGRATPERLADGSTLWHGFLADINERKQLEQEQLEQAEHTQAILDNVINGIITINEAGVVGSANPAAEDVFGYTADEMIGMKIGTLIPGLQKYRSGQLFAPPAGSGKPLDLGVTYEVEGVRASGHIFPMELAMSKISRQGNPLHIAVIRDISQRKETDKEIHHLAFFDPLTQLPNRRLFYDRLNHARAASQRNQNYGAIFFIDLDNFKRLNDTEGHSTGDKLLQVVAMRLSDCVRENDTVARLGGDEFVLVMEDVGEDEQTAIHHAENAAEKIRLSLNQPYAEIRPAYKGTSSIGVTLFTGDEVSVEELLKQVDMAMYQAKLAGRNKVMFFDPAMQAAAVAYATLENELRTALVEQQFELFYQVQVDNRGQPTGAEALLRWHHPKKGCVRPGEFVYLAEETRLILPIGRWVIEAACRQLAAWAEHPDTAHLVLAVNVSALQLAEPDFPKLVLDSLSQAGANPKKLKLELTETLLAQNIESVIAKMTVLQSRGITFALDDFGTGYSSLSYLKKMPIEQLKIDQSFVRDILVDNSDSIIAKSIIVLAKSMGLGVIAEGVESEAHFKALVAEGCLNHQGYLFGHPLPVHEFEQSLRR